jgi:hypothetical protein
LFIIVSSKISDLSISGSISKCLAAAGYWPTLILKRKPLSYFRKTLSTNRWLGIAAVARPPLPATVAVEE